MSVCHSYVLFPLPAMISGLLTSNLFSSRAKSKDFFLFPVHFWNWLAQEKNLWSVLLRVPYHGFGCSRCKVFLIHTVQWPWGNQELNMELLALWHIFPESTIDFILWYIVSSITACAWTEFCSSSFLWPAADNVSSSLFNIPCGFCATLLTFYDTLLWQSFF